MPIANSYVTPTPPYTGPTVSTPTDVTPGPATGTTVNAQVTVDTVSNTPPVTPGVATSTEPVPPLPNPENYNLTIAIARPLAASEPVAAATEPAGANGQIQFNFAGTFGASANLTFSNTKGLIVSGPVGRTNADPELVGNSALTVNWTNVYAGNFWANFSEGRAWIAGDYNASASFVLIDNEESVKYPDTITRTYEQHPAAIFKPNQFLTGIRMQNKPVTGNAWANILGPNGMGRPDLAATALSFSNDANLRNPMPISSGAVFGNATITTNPAFWPSWFRLPCAEEALEAENDQPIFESYNPAFAYVYGALPQVQGGGLQVYHPRRDTMVHITGNTIIGINNVYHWASNAYYTDNPGPQGNLQGDLRLQGYGNGNVIISKNDYRDGWNPSNPANTWPGKYNYSNIYNYQTGVHNGEQNNLLIEYGNVVIQPVANVANNTLGIKFADGTFQYTAANGGGGGSSSIAVQEEGTNVVASANTINFVGSGVTASNVSGVATITIPGIAVQEEGTNVVASANRINFVGSGVTASNVGNVATITITSGGISGIAVQEEGTNVLATANTINFVGSGVTASNVGNVATITITSGGISGVTVQDEGTNVLVTANTINFVGSGVTASNVGNVATINITSGGISGIDILYDASPVTANATTINFTGPLANVANVGFGNATDVTIGLTVQDESNVVGGNSTFGTLNFLGAGVTATSGPSGVANITIPGVTPGGANTQLQFNDAGSFGGMPLVTYSNVANGRYLNVSGNATTNAAVYYTYANASNIAVTGISTQEGNAFVSGWSGSTGSKIAIYPGDAGNIELALGNSAGRILMGDVGTIQITGGSNGQVLTTNGAGNLSWTTVSGSGGSGLPGYLRTYTGNVTISNGSNVYLWYPLTLDNTAIINTINASDYPNGLISLQAGTYLFETTVPITNTGSDSIINVYTAFIENTPANGLTPIDSTPGNIASVVARCSTMRLGDFQTGSVYGIGTFTLATETKVSLMFAQYGDLNPGATVYGNPYSETGAYGTSLVVKLWKTA